MNRIIKIGSIITLAIITIGIFTAQNVKANPRFFPVVTKLTTSTTSPIFIQAGLATTTMAVDSYQSGNPTAFLQGTLLVQVSATTSNPALNINVEYAHDPINGQDCTVVQGACDWFQNTGTPNLAYSTTSKAYDISQVSSFNWNFTPSNAGLGATVAGNASSTRAISINIPTRYARFVFSVPNGAGTSAVWAEFVPLKERVQ